MKSFDQLRLSLEEQIAEVTMGNSTKADAIKKKAIAAKKELDKLIKQLQKLDVDASEIAKLKEETLIKEGLWDNIRAKRAAGKPKAKPGDKGYPKTLDIEQVSNEDLVKEDMKAGKYKKGDLIVMGQWPNPDAWVKEYIMPNIDKKGVRIYSTGPSFKIEKL